MDILSIMENNFFVVDLYYDEKQKYKVICLMNFWYSFRDIITDKEIQIKNEDDLYPTNRGLICKNTMYQISKEEVDKILKEYSQEDIKKYEEYLTNIENKSIKVYDEIKYEYLEQRKSEKGKVKRKSYHNKLNI